MSSSMDHIKKYVVVPPFEGQTKKGAEEVVLFGPDGLPFGAKADPVWTPLVLNNPAKAHPDYDVPAYLVSGDWLHLKGAIRSDGAAFYAMSTLANLPEDARPKKNRLVPIYYSGLTYAAGLYITTTGNIVPSNDIGQTQSVWLDGIRVFRS